MLIKIKQLIYPLVGITLLLTGIIALASSPVEAAFSPAPAPQCFSNAAGGGVPCNQGFFQTQAAKQGLKFENNKCYEDVRFGSTLVVGFADCNQHPFTVNQSVRCSDNAVHSGAGSKEEICKAFGGVYQEPNTTCEEATDVCGFFAKYINPAIKFLSAGVGVIVTIMIIVGGIQYSSAGGDPQKVAGAKQRILNALIALLAYALLFAFLQWVVPGGVI